MNDDNVLFIPASLVSEARKEARKTADKEMIIGIDPYFGLVYRDVGDFGGVANLSAKISVRTGRQPLPCNDYTHLKKVRGGWELSVENFPSYIYE